MSKALPVFLVFLAMGFVDAVGPFVGLARDQFHLSNFTAQLITLAGLISFGFLSVPMGVLQDRIGKKMILLLGLVIMLAGLVIPAIFGFSTFPVFLVTVVLMGAGATTMQVAGNPIMRDISAEGKYSRNLSLAQFVKSIGTFSGAMVPMVAARYFGVSWQVIFPIYSVAVAIAIVACLPLKAGQKEAVVHQPTTFGSCLSLLFSNGWVALMVFAIFFYVGAEVSVSSGIPIYLKDRFGLDVNQIGVAGTGLFMLALTIGRFSGSVILNWMKPQRFLQLTCLVSLLGLAGLFAPSKELVAVSFFVIGIGFANIFPLVFSITVDAMPERVNALSGLMVSAIVGGACLPPIMGLVSDQLGSVQLGFIVPIAAVVYCTVTALVKPRTAA